MCNLHERYYNYNVDEGKDNRTDRSVYLLPGPAYFPGPNCMVLETGYVFLLHLSYTHRHFPNKLLCLHLLTGCFPNKNPCRHLPIEAD